LNGDAALFMARTKLSVSSVAAAHGLQVRQWIANRSASAVDSRFMTYASAVSRMSIGHVPCGLRKLAILRNSSTKPQQSCVLWGSQSRLAPALAGVRSAQLGNVGWDLRVFYCDTDRPSLGAPIPALECGAGGSASADMPASPKRPIRPQVQYFDGRGGWRNTCLIPVGSP
jgi:hypothetical protein